MPLRFEWDAKKASANEQKHGVSFEEAASLFADPLSITIANPDHSASEDRFITVGVSAAGRILVVMHTDRGDLIRVISARLATRRERRSYEEEA